MALLDPRFDVVIAGGGPAGTAAALSLVKAGRRVLMVDKTARSPARDALEPGEGLVPAARRLLQRLGLDVDHLMAPQRRALGTQSAWGSSRLLTRDFLRDPDGHGWHLDRARFDADLRRAAERSGVVWRPASRVTSIARRPPAWRLAVVDSKDRTVAVDCRWWIDATGRAGRLMTHADATDASVVETIAHDRLIGIAQLYRQGDGDATDPDAMTLVEADADGWWYSAPLPRGRRIVVFFTDADLAAARQARDADGFQCRVLSTTHIAARLQRSGWLPQGEPLGGPAASVERRPIVGDDWLATGDAAMAFDPISSRGIFNALYTGRKAGLAVDDALSGEHSSTAAYATELAGIYAAYRRHLGQVYDSERRFAGPFWQRRQQVPEASSYRSRSQISSMTSTPQQWTGSLRTFSKSNAS